MKRILLGIATMIIMLGITGNTFSVEKGVKPAEKGEAKPVEEKAYWDRWEKGRANGVIPPCGINVLPLGGDDILQATVDVYCAMKPGKYESFINPAVMKVYKEKGSNYPDGKTAVLVFKEIGATFTTDHKGGKPIYDVIAIKDGKSIASKEKGHPLNPETCANCHAGFKGICAGYICGNRH